MHHHFYVKLPRNIPSVSQDVLRGHPPDDAHTQPAASNDGTCCKGQKIDKSKAAIYSIRQGITRHFKHYVSNFEFFVVIEYYCSCWIFLVFLEVCNTAYQLLLSIDERPGPPLVWGREINRFETPQAS